MSLNDTPTSGIGKDDGIAVIGLGKMGLPMARNLRAAGFRVCGYDPVAAQCDAAKALGVDIAETPAAAVAETAIALIVVGFDNEVEAVVTEEGTGLLAAAKPGYVITICSTIEPNTSVALAQIARQGRGADHVGEHQDKKAEGESFHERLSWRAPMSRR